MPSLSTTGVLKLSAILLAWVEANHFEDGAAARFHWARVKAVALTISVPSLAAKAVKPMLVCASLPMTRTGK
ncbi:hypothetical protein [Agrobacterium sp.]|jgi:hypothetical protein|uniref:hypothetical protein n=1 Tax=Agrobacterium sp. TaxID=361 RepID=UPI0028A660C1